MSMDDFRDLVDLASERLGGTALAANDEFFAGRENLVKAAAPVFREGEYTDRGKWMDGWETRRRRDAGYDWCLVRLGLPGIIRGLVVDTAHFKGNYPESCSIEVCDVAGAAGLEPLTAPVWTEILPQSAPKGIAKTPSRSAATAASRTCANIYPRRRRRAPARLRARRLDWPRPPGGGRSGPRVRGERGPVLLASDMFFDRHNLILPGGMSDGWERGAGADQHTTGPSCGWDAGAIGAPRWMAPSRQRPGGCSIEVANVGRGGADAGGVPRCVARFLLANAFQHLHRFEEELERPGRRHARLNIRRRRQPLEALCPAHAVSGLAAVNAMAEEEASAAMLACCGSKRWARRMTQARPFSGEADLIANADRIWSELSGEDWLEAFAAHPKIGAPASGQAAAEQAGARGASAETLAALANVKREYEDRFGYIFMVCLGPERRGNVDLCRRRLHNAP
jgi:allantoicase